MLGHLCGFVMRDDHEEAGPGGDCYDLEGIVMAIIVGEEVKSQGDPLGKVT